MLCITVEALKHTIHIEQLESIFVSLVLANVCHIHAKADVLGAAVDNCWWIGPHGREALKADFCGGVALRVLEVSV